jgi:arabinofuranosyltransferase
VSQEIPQQQQPRSQPPLPWWHGALFGQIHLPPARYWAIPALLLGLLVVVLRSAWLCDDAYITYRVVDNFWNGYGLRWNVAERVWVYTNPLMMLSMLALYPLTGEFFYTGIFFSVAVSMAAATIAVYTMARTAFRAAVVIALLAVSKAWVDWSTSGLENCLTYLILAGAYWLAFRRDGLRNRTLLAVAAMCSLALLNRMDTILLVFPLLVAVWWDKPTFRRVAIAAAGFLPFVAWEVFALIYYGRPFPNTAYAKLSTGIPAWFYLDRGSDYFLQSLFTDPITLPVIFSACLAGVFSRRRRPLAAALGLVLYLAYVLRVGGSFMGGRYFSGPLLAAVMLWCVVPLPGPVRLRRAAGVGVILACVVLAVVHPLSPPLVRGDYTLRIRPDLQLPRFQYGVCDERGYYFPTMGLLRAGRWSSMPAHSLRYQGQEYRSLGACVVRADAIGLKGLYAGPHVHIVDKFALSDPLLAVAPARRDGPIRIGHIPRYVPMDYMISLAKGRNLLQDPGLAKLYDVLERVHRGPIWSAQRWRDIWRLNTGGYDPLIDRERFQYPNDPNSPPEQMQGTGNRL